VLGFIAVAGVAAAFWQLRELRHQRGAAESLDLLERLNGVLAKWREERFLPWPDQAALAECITHLMGLYEISAGLINRGMSVRVVRVLMLNHMKGILKSFCSDEMTAKTILEVAQDEDVYSEIRLCLLERRRFFELADDRCLRQVFFAQAPDVLFSASIQGWCALTGERRRLRRVTNAER
jgi:hypothetical protein